MFTEKTITCSSYLKAPSENIAKTHKVYKVMQNVKPIYNHFHNILRLFDVLPNFPVTTSETMRD